MIEELIARHAAVLDEQRPDAVAKQHAKGQLTARERIALLLDDGEELIESGSLAEPANRSLRAPADAVVIGLGQVHGRTSVVVSFDYTVLGGTQGVNNHAKSSRAALLAERYQAPLYMLAEGGGARTQEMSSFRTANSSGDFEWLARLSGRVPLIGVALGRAFAGHAIFLGECDAIIATERSAVGVAGPPLVKAATGHNYTPEEIGGARIHEAAGAAERIVIEDADAIAEARAYGAYFVQPVRPYRENRPGLGAELRQQAERGPGRSMRRIIELVADAGSLFELRPTWSTNVITTLARLEGRSVGIIATDPQVNGGALTATGCDKIARFTAVCNAFGLPLLTFVDTVGPTRAADASGSALFRHAARVPIATSRVRVPAATFLIGQVGGVAQVLLGGFGRFLDGPMHFMWPGAQLVGLGATAETGSPLAIAQGYDTDDVIDPARTREVAARVLAAAPPISPSDQFSPIDPW
jgi:acetyl-CoA carboxylase carboxyltransferase component